MGGFCLCLCDFCFGLLNVVDVVALGEVLCFEHCAALYTPIYIAFMSVDLAYAQSYFK